MKRFNRMLTLGLVVSVVWTSLTPELVAGKETTSGEKSLRQGVLAIPSGTMVEVKLINKEKYRGRMGFHTENGFAVQTATGSNIEEKTVTFGQVRSIKTLRSKGTPVRRRLASIGKGVAMAPVFILLFPVVGPGIMGGQ